MRLETFSYLPGLSSEQLAQQIRSILGRHLVVGIEYASAPDPYDHYWTMWKLPLFDTDDPAVVLAELEACRQANPGAYIKVNGYDPVRQGQVVSFVAAQPQRVP
ncbi:MAG TPA: ribulose bisphosphate carboxylase small subunit [Streptosporangiaceae bacterium]|nr:ribulose bisphosphate carboxylase small subunit [Streptosporangiaceae bacterium]